MKLKLTLITAGLIGLVFVLAGSPVTPPSSASPKKDFTLVPHKALYEINLVSTKSGSQIVDVGGEMYYELTSGCDAWITNHRFQLRYDYIDSPSVRVKSNFSTYESHDGESFNFTSTRRRDGAVFEELKGQAYLNPVPGSAGGGDRLGTGKAIYAQPEGLSFDLPDSTRFPMRHTLDLLARAEEGEKFFNSVVFDGSDDEGPVSINAFIGPTVNAMARVTTSPKIDVTLLNTAARTTRLAFFPVDQTGLAPDYEMEMIIHDNGVVSDMLVEYDTFSVTQKLVALEKLPADTCSGE